MLENQEDSSLKKADTNTEAESESRADETYEDDGIEDDIEIISYEVPVLGARNNAFTRFVEKVNRVRKIKAVRIALQLLGSLFMLAIAAGIGIFLAVGKVKGGPLIFADEYFNYYINGNWYSMYQATEIEESEFINMSSFARFMAQTLPDGEITGYNIEVEERDGEFADIKIVYKINRSDETLSNPTAGDETPTEATPGEANTEGGNPATEGTYYMTLKKQPEKILLFYTTWKGYMDNYIIKDCTIEVPSYVSPIFDGVNIKDCYQGENPETGLSVYKLDRVFKGRHSIQLMSETIDTQNKEVVWEKDNDTFVIGQADIPIKADDKKAVEEKALQLVVSYYQTALAGENGDTIKSMLYPGEAAYAHADELLAEMGGAINQSDGRTLVSMEITSYTCTIEDYKYNQSLSVKVDYTASYNAKKPRTVIDGVRRSYAGANSAAARIYFSYIDNTWVATNIDISCIDYTVEAEAET